jgi:hypothetical protein
MAKAAANVKSGPGEFKDRLLAVFDEFNDAKADGKITLHEGFSVCADIARVIETLADEAAPTTRPTPNSPPMWCGSCSTRCSHLTFLLQGVGGAYHPEPGSADHPRDYGLYPPPFFAAAKRLSVFGWPSKPVTPWRCFEFENRR